MSYSQEKKALPQLLLPPGPSVHSIDITKEGKITHRDASNTTHLAPQLFIDAWIVRGAVFVIEQKCPGDEEIDADDGISWHWLTYEENQAHQKAPVANIRLVPAQAHPDSDDQKAIGGPNYAGSHLWDHKEPYVKITRLATVEEARGKGYARTLVEEAFSYAGRNSGDMVKDKELGDWKGLVLIFAQTKVEGWYKKLGFETDEGLGKIWEAGIEHVGMWRRVEVRA